MEKVEKEPPVEHYGELARDGHGINLQVGRAGDLDKPHSCQIPKDQDPEVGEIFYCPCGRAWQRWM